MTAPAAPCVLESRPRDLRMTGSLTLEAGDGTTIVEIAIDEMFPELFAADRLGLAAPTVRDVFRNRMEVPARALVLAYIERLKAARYSHGFRLDEPLAHCGWPPADAAGEQFMDAVFEQAMRDHDLDVTS